MTLSAKCFSCRERERDLFIPIQLATLSSVGFTFGFCDENKVDKFRYHNSSHIHALEG